MSSEGWVYSLETEEAADDALYEATLFRDEARSYMEIVSDMYTDILWEGFNLLTGPTIENSVSDSTEYQKIGTDIVPKDENAKRRLEDSIENQDLKYEIIA